MYRHTVKRSSSTCTTSVAPNDFYRFGASGHVGVSNVMQVKDTCSVNFEGFDTANSGSNDACELSGRSEQSIKKHVLQRPEFDMYVFNSGSPVLCWDTETAGLGMPGICQLAYVMISEDGFAHMYDKVWKLPDGVYMSKGAAKIHGITADRSNQDGICPLEDLVKFYELVENVIKKGGVVVGHNVQFDCRAFNFTSKKWGLDKCVDKNLMMDTMLASKRYSRLTTVNGNQKAFKNDELCECRCARVCVCDVNM